ncbi:hypothetical protein HV146_16330 [Escherichia coli]|uniref:Uncharacterized protein n=1 Tax=Escherichia whittamii TaxID=2762229 RepID=A0ABR8TFI7_9ESCH|nr:hypothetical protein [Escherichia whittamii]QLX47099.1 hypothetical protein HV146_16330 [Escherichia coli]
MNAINRFYFSN